MGTFSVKAKKYVVDVNRLHVIPQARNVFKKGEKKLKTK